MGVEKGGYKSMKKLLMVGIICIWCVGDWCNGGAPYWRMLNLSKDALADERIPDGFGLAKEAVIKIFEELRQVAGLGEEWQVVILPDVMGRATVNAFKKRVYISYKFVQSLHCKGELACVLGHELAHVSLGHTSEDTTLKHGDVDLREAEADYLGYLYARRAGCVTADLCDVLKRYGFPQKRQDRLLSLLQLNGYKN